MSDIFIYFFCDFKKELILRSNYRELNPTEALIAVTYNCNARCTMCNIWQTKNDDKLTPQDFTRLPKSLRDINITGGEPFMRNDLPEIIEAISTSNPKTRIIISSNGLLTSKIVKTMQEIMKINNKVAIAFSIDGLKETHNKVRGLDTAYDSVIRTITGLRSKGINDIRIAFTAGKDNLFELSRVYNLTKVMNLEFTMSVVHNSDNYFNIEDNLEPPAEELKAHLDYILKEEYNHANPRRLARTYYLRGLYDYVKTHKRPLKCRALKDFFYLDPNGEVFPCNILSDSIGNIKEKSFEELWNLDNTFKLKNHCENCDKCWMVCTSKSSIRKEIFKVANSTINDVIKTKIKQLT